MTRWFAILIVIVTASMARAQDAAAGEDPCAVRVKTLHSCWECFNKILDLCDKTPSPDRRKACYGAAQHYFEWCLEQMRGSGNSGSAGSVIPPRWDPEIEDLVMILPASGDVGVTLRTADGKREVAAKVEALPSGHTKVTVSDPGSLPADIGVVVRVEQGGEVIWAQAALVAIINEADVNGDGNVDIFDILELTNKVQSGEIDIVEGARLAALVSSH